MLTQILSFALLRTEFSIGKCYISPYTYIHSLIYFNIEELISVGCVQLGGDIVNKAEKLEEKLKSKTILNPLSHNDLQRL